MKEKSWFRILFAVFVPLILSAALYFIYLFGSLIPCPFYTITGIYCPGCGNGRALYALLHFDILTCLRNNILFLPLSFLIIWYFLNLYLKIVFLKTILPDLNFSLNFSAVLIVSIILFWIVRNIKIYPFTLLAPV